MTNENWLKRHNLSLIGQPWTAEEMSQLAADMDCGHYSRHDILESARISKMLTTRGVTPDLFTGVMEGYDGRIKYAVGQTERGILGSAATKSRTSAATATSTRVLEKQGREPWGKIYETKPHTWNLPFRMQKKAIADNRRYKLFTCSLSDWFHKDADKMRPRAWDIVRRCPDVDFLVLTKRADRIAANLPPDWGSGWPNVWLGVSVGRMKTAWRLDELRKVPAIVHFVSAEPLLESLADLDLADIEWLIAGGESGPNWRRMETSWAEELRDKCISNGTTFFFKQGSGFASGNNPDLLGQIYHNWPK